MGAGDDMIAGFLHGRATTASSRPRRAAPAGRRPCTPARRSSPMWGERPNYSRPTSPRSFPVSPRSAAGGLRASLRVRAARAGADGEPRRPRTRASCDARPCWRSSWSPTRTTARRARAPHLYDTTANTPSSRRRSGRPEHPLQRVRSLCNGVRPPRVAPNGPAADTVTLQNCASSECDGALTPVAEFVARDQGAKASPGQRDLIARSPGR